MERGGWVAERERATPLVVVLNGVRGMVPWDGSFDPFLEQRAHHTVRPEHFQASHFIEICSIQEESTTMY